MDKKSEIQDLDLGYRADLQKDTVQTGYLENETP